MTNIRKRPDKTDQDLLDEYFEGIITDEMVMFKQYNRIKIIEDKKAAIEKELGKDKIQIEENRRKLRELPKITNDLYECRQDFKSMKKTLYFIFILLILITGIDVLIFLSN